MKLSSNRKNRKSIFTFLLLSIIAVLFIIPFIWVIATSLKPEAEVFSLTWLPGDPQWSNYSKVLKNFLSSLT
jgi:multiple sugar transport system permease protein